MLTLRDIDAVTEYSDGSGYSDLFKEVYGFRPRGVTFATIEEFNKDYEYISEQAALKDQEEKIRQERNWIKFVARVEATMELVSGIDRTRAIEIIADAEGELQSMKWYGYESLEYHFNLKFGSIKKWLES